MSVTVQRERVAILWQLTWTNDSVIACSVYRVYRGFELCVESNGELVVSEHCELQPRAVARAQALRDSLVRRGWKDTTGAARATQSGDPPPA